MGLSPVMEIWNVTDLWNLIEAGRRWRQKDGRKITDKTGFMITSMNDVLRKDLYTCALQV